MIKQQQQFYLVSEVCHRLGIDEEFISRCIEANWIRPAEPESVRLDEEDIARIELIRELREDFGANEEAIPIILHLMDQLYYLRSRLSHFQKELAARQAGANRKPQKIA